MHEKWRGNVYKMEECEGEMKKNRAKLEDVFFRSCSRHWRLGERKYMYFEDLKDVFMLNKTDEIYSLTHQKLRLVFFYSKKGPIDYYSSDNYRRLYFPEFLESLARASSMADCAEFRDNHLLTLKQKLAHTIKSLTGS